MRDYAKETTQRVAFIRDILAASGAKGIVYGNSGGKDSALVGILCKMACENTVGILMPCGSKRNYSLDKPDGEALAAQYGIAVRYVDLGDTQESLVHALGTAAQLTDTARANIAPRLRMVTLYAIAASEGRLVAGTGNRSEAYMGYFTKWGDGAFDFNPIGDLTVTEIYEFLRHLGAPSFVLEKAPSAGLFDGQTDETEMGVTYSNIDAFLFTGEASPADRRVIDRFHAQSEHKRKAVIVYGGE